MNKARHVQFKIRVTPVFAKMINERIARYGRGRTWELQRLLEFGLMFEELLLPPEEDESSAGPPKDRDGAQ